MLEVKILEVSVTQMGFAIVLQPHGEKKVVPIFIGPLETYSISSALEGQKSERPMTHDLIKTILISTDYKVSKVVINNFKNGTFYARLFLLNLTTKDEIEIDARPSDSISLAVRFGAPIYMDELVYEKVSVDIDLIRDKKRDESVGEFFDPENEGLGEAFSDDSIDHELIQSILEDFTESPSSKSRDQQRKSKLLPEGNETYKSKEEVLQQMLKTAIKHEKYEEAAKLRDEINKLILESEKSNKRKNRE